jgi:uncharacterized iron-regulated membrane protein
MLPAMWGFRWFWNTHKWTGLTLGAVFVLTAVTGVLLLLKKEFHYLQPPTQKGTPGAISSFLSVDDVTQAVLTEGHPHFQSADDIDRIDVRPAKHVFKVRSKHEDAEIQICATTGRVLRIDVRRSDWLERLHDGSWIGDWFKIFAMPLAGLGLLYLVFSGYWIWLQPKINRARRKRGAKGPDASN